MVIQLLNELEAMVGSMHPSVTPPPVVPWELVDGTAFFPGGSGLWRGRSNGGSLPEHFPDRCVMFVGHNYDNVSGFDRAVRDRGEVERPFWRDRFIPILEAAGVLPGRCFFTNALVGFKAGTALGKVAAVDGYEQQCTAFLARQIEIVGPAAIVSLGAEALRRVRRVTVDAKGIMHPSARQFSALATRRQRVQAEAALLRSILAGVGSSDDK